MNSTFDDAGRHRRKAASVVVVIPFFNGSEFIERSARSVLEQTVPPTEFIVVDDGSRPDEAEKLSAIAARMGFRVLRKENGGQGSARNAGVAASSADYICFLDQDDFYLRNHIEILLDALPDDDPHFGWVYGELFEADKDANIVRTNIVSSMTEHPKTSIFEIIRKDMFVLPSASLISRHAYLAVGGFDEQFMGYEDDDLFMRLFRSGFSNYFTEKAVTVWCIHTESTSYGIRMARSRLKYFEKLVQLFPDDPDKNRYYLKDVFLRRFHNAIMRDAIAASLGWPKRFKQFKSEYISIAEQLVGIMERNRYVSRLLTMRTRLMISVLKHVRLELPERFESLARFVYLLLSRSRRAR